MTQIQVNEEQRRQMIAEAAYFKAETRGFGGNPVEDWLEAESEIDSRLGRHDTWLAGLEERLATANEWLTAFGTKVSHVKSEAREEWDSDLEKLRKHRNRLRRRVKALRDQSEHATERAKLKAEEVWDDITAVADRLRHRKSGHS
jgi:chromosome segregation ATPase